jgi:hypothetical protein
MRKRATLSAATLIVIGALVAILLFGNGWLAGYGAPRVHAAAQSSHSNTANATVGGVTIQDMQSLFFVWASGTPAVQQVAASDCGRLSLSAQQCAQISASVRAAWLDLAARDPSATGRPNMHPNLAGRAQALDALSAQLAGDTNGQTSALLATTATTIATISQPQWVRAHVLAGRALPAGTELVWATSYAQSSLPGGLNPKRSPYAALPDAYLKYADWGQLSTIPSFYQGYYAPGGKTAHWSVNVANAQGTRSVANVPITDVGPWNEDDNWWDANGSSTAIPANCPVASPLAFPDATANALVDGVCPSGASGGNLRRIYYYLLYQHYGLPFFQAAGYVPTGSFADGTNWPLALPQYCSEAAAASKNADGIACYSGTAPYNNANGGWLRNGTYDAGVTNQSSIDLSPMVNKDLGWTYPSSGLVQVTVSTLP